MKNQLGEMFGTDESLGVVFLVDGCDEPVSPERLDEMFVGMQKEGMPEARSFFCDGLDAICCTNYAIQVAKALPGRTRIFGFANEDNPTSRVAREEIHPGGHDFAIVDDRYIVDPWIRLVAAVSEQVVFDLMDPNDAAVALDIYGPRACWRVMDILNGDCEQNDKQLAERIKANLSEPQHRFELQDPFAETTFRFPTSEAATAKADALGASRFQHRDADGSVKQVDKVDGQWWVRNEPLPPQNSQQPPAQEDKPLASVQEAIDRESLSAIEARAEQRAGVGQGFDADKEMAVADAHAFRRIQDPSRQEGAAVVMAGNAHDYPEYKAGLDNAIPGYPGTAEKVYALDAANTDKVMAKEIRKSQEYADMIAVREEMARSWTPEESAKRAQADSEAIQAETNKFDRAYLVYDMIRDAKANPHYKEALEKVAPELAQEVTGERQRIEQADGNADRRPRPR